jgi:hypothetical protein
MQLFLVSRNTLLALLWSLVARIPHSALHSCSIKKLPSAFWQTEGLFKLFRLVWWMCVHPLLWLFLCFNIHEWNPVSSPVLYTIWLEIERHICGIGLKISKPSPYVLCAPLTISGYAGITDNMTLKLLTLTRRQWHSDRICCNGSLKANRYAQVTAEQFDTTVWHYEMLRWYPAVASTSAFNGT